MKSVAALGLCGCLALACLADERPIGVFDSGLGGLTVLERLLDCDRVNNETGAPGADGIPDFAHERFVYLGDQANMPYGDYAAEKKSDLLKELIVDDAKFLLGTSFHRSAQEKVPTGKKDRAKILVIACNTATAWGLEEVRNRLKAAGDDTQVVGVIEAGVRATLDLLKADKASPSFAVGVLATPGTIASGAYTKTLRIELAARGIDCEVPVYGQGCAGLADAVEACSPTADQIAVDNLRKMLEQHRASGAKAPLRAVILGCTHFPFVQSALEKALAEERAKGANIAADCCFVDPAIYTAAECYRLLKKNGLLAKTLQPAPSAAFLSVANPDLAKEHLMDDGQLTRAFKYGRSIDGRVGTTKPIPFTHANFKPEVFAQVGRLLPRTAALLEAVPSFTMRIDDNHSPAEWKRVAEIFESRGMRVSFAIVPSSLSDAQGACLKELSDRGHVIMDHTPNHTFYRATYHDIEAFNSAKTKPFVLEVDEKGKILFFRPTVDDAHPQNCRVKAKIEKNVLTFTDAKAPKRTYYTFIKIPGRSEVFGLASRNGVYDLRDFWRRPLKEQIDLAKTEVLLYDQAAIQPCDDILRELARVSRERFAHFNLPLPTIWVRPGGWDPGVQWERLERIYGREFGYIGADSSVGGVWGGSRWTTGYDAMYFFDQGADITPEQLVDQIEKRLAAGKYHVTLSHMWNNKLPGRMDEYYQKTERFAQLLVDRKIPFLTMKGTLDARFGK
ncbi:MAG: aspartate/glutamate racemase family protein [bacterium]|nr:aspartate/glutamate racemase family protein [bacterium]